MKKIDVSSEIALDHIVMKLVQRFEDIHPRTQATMHMDEKTGDEFIMVHDPVMDQCLIVWFSPAWYGNNVLALAKNIISSNLKR
jgi:hypothetical protein